MWLIFFLGLLLGLYFRNIILFVLTNFHNFIIWGFRDIRLYYKHKEFNRCKEWGMIRLNCATSSQVFGCGKTLLLVIRALKVYKKYNDKLVWNDKEKKFVKQKIHIISNVELYGVPYVKFTGVNQLIDIQDFGYGEDDITIFLLDESGAIFNSRQYRDNISTEFLTRLLQSRKHKVALYMTSQRFQFTDKILREVCSTVTTCRKWWRVVVSKNYDAYEVENAVNTSLVRPRSVNYSFIFDSDYHSYNSYQLVENLRKDYKPGMYLDTAEILETYGTSAPDLRLVNHPSKKARRIMKN